MPPSDPHRNCSLHYVGAPMKQARLVVVAVHGRYGKTDDIMKFANQVDEKDVAWIAPQAAGGSWWTESFLAPLSRNEPGLSSALNRLTAITEDLAQQEIGPERIILTGFSQGACLILEHAARYPKPWRGIVAMSGGLIGCAEGDGRPRDELYGYGSKRFDYRGDLAKVPIHMSCHAEDPVIPATRVRHSADVLGRMGAQVALDICVGKMHGVVPSDIQALQKLVDRNLRCRSG